MKVSSKPNLTLKMLLKKRVGCQPQVFPFNTGRCLFFYSARYALAAAIRALRLSSRQTVLLPAYNCGVEIDPFIRDGVKVDWYRVNGDFSIDTADIVRRIKPETSALLVIHYLGFPQQLSEVRTICTERGIFLIEDCAHALFSDVGGVPLGSTGDMAIFSPRKSLPIPDGGCLLINNPAIDFERATTISPSRFATYYVISEMLSQQTMGKNIFSELPSNILFSLNLTLAQFIRLALRVAHKLMNDSGDYLVYPSGNVFRDNVKNWYVSECSSAIINCFDFISIKAQRRANFIFLLNYFKESSKYQLPLRCLPEGVCPLHFPVIIEKRDLLYSLLKKEGICGHDWWGDFHPDVPWNEYPDIVYMKKHIFGFPIHQDLTPYQLEMILKLFENIMNHLQK